MTATVTPNLLHKILTVMQQICIFLLWITGLEDKNSIRIRPTWKPGSHPLEDQV